MNYIVDDIGAVVKRMDPFTNPVREIYYMYGHRQYIANTLLEKDGDMVYKHQKYPLVALRLDTVERHGDLIEFSLNIGFFEFSLKEDIDKRYDKVFKKTLYPMYESFLTELNNSGLFEWPGFLTRPPHTKIDRPFWGTEEKERNSSYIFNDPLDAIEILDLKINQTIKC